MTFMMPCMMLIMNGISVLIIYNGSYAVDGGNMQVGDMMAFIQYAMQIIMAFLMITAMSIMLPRANVAALRIVEVLETKNSLEDPEHPVQPSGNEKGTVEFDHVSFAYPDAGENVLTDISFKAKKGQTLAVIGSTGSGKSTLVNLIPRFYDATSGSVRVDGVDVRSMSQKDLRPSRLCSAEGHFVLRNYRFQHPLWKNGHFRTGSKGSGRNCSGGGLYRGEKLSVPVSGSPGRNECFRRPEAEAFHCQSDCQETGNPDF